MGVLDFSHRAVLTTREGDPRFFFDDSQTPQAYGTGTEEWGGGGDYWGGRNMTLPLAGHPVGAPSAQDAKCDEDLIQSAYRFLLADLMPFGRRAVIRLEHGGENQSAEHYERLSTGMVPATLLLTDELQIGDATSERVHTYRSPQASEPYSITSRYEWGVDTIPAKPGQAATDNDPADQPGEVLGGGRTMADSDSIVYPPHTDVGRKTKGVSEFSLRLHPDNYGGCCCSILPPIAPRVLDRGMRGSAVQLAEGATLGCGSTRIGEELGAHSTSCRPPTTISGRRVSHSQGPRADERIRVQIRFTPVAIPLFPAIRCRNWPGARSATAYCWVMPQWTP
jgi:hypothetical protein